jgi:hypothetical protein
MIAVKQVEKLWIEMRVKLELTDVAVNAEMFYASIAGALRVDVDHLSDVMIVRGGKSRQLQSGPVDVDISYVVTVPDGMTADGLSLVAGRVAGGGSFEQSAFRQHLLDNSGLVATNIGILAGPHIFLDDTTETSPPPPPPPPPPVVEIPPASDETSFPTVSLENPLPTSNKEAADSSSTMLLLMICGVAFLICTACTCKARDMRRRSKVACDPDLESGAKTMEAPGVLVDFVLAPALLTSPSHKFKAGRSFEKRLEEQPEIVTQECLVEQMDTGCLGKAMDAPSWSTGQHHLLREVASDAQSCEEPSIARSRTPSALGFAAIRGESTPVTLVDLSDASTESVASISPEVRDADDAECIACSEWSETSIRSDASKEGCSHVNSGCAALLAAEEHELAFQNESVPEGEWPIEVHACLDELQGANDQLKALNADGGNLVADARRLNEMHVVLEARPFAGESPEEREERRRRRKELKATKRALRAQAETWKIQSKQAFNDSDEKMATVVNLANRACVRDQTLHAIDKTKRLCLPQSGIDEVHFALPGAPLPLGPMRSQAPIGYSRSPFEGTVGTKS